MSVKKRVAIVMFMLITCIATICFATKVEKSEAVEEVNSLKEIEYEIEGKAKPGEFVDSKASEDEEFIGAEEGYLEALKTSGNVKGTKNVIRENVYHADSTSPYTLKDNVNGNIFLAGTEITIDSSYISGDVFAAATNTITISENTVIDGNVYIAAQTVNIYGTIYRTGYIAGKVINLGEKSNIEYDAYIGGEKIELAGELARNAYVMAETLEVKETATVARNLTYEAEEEAKIPEGIVRGEVKFNKITIEKKATKDLVWDYVMKMFGALIFTLVVFLIISLMSKKFNYKSQELLGKHPFRTLGIGLFSLIIIPILALILMILGVTLKLGIALIPVYLTIILLANSVTAISIASLLCARRDGMQLPIVVPIIAVILWALEEIPTIGILVEFISILIGVGIIMQVIFSGNKTISKGEKEVKEEIESPNKGEKELENKEEAVEEKEEEKKEDDKEEETEKKEEKEEEK